MVGKGHDLAQNCLASRDRQQVGGWQARSCHHRLEQQLVGGGGIPARVVASHVHGVLGQLACEAELVGQGKARLPRR